MEERPGTSLDNEDLFLILKMMEESDWDELELKGKGFRLVVGKNAPHDCGTAQAVTFTPPSRVEEKVPAPIPPVTPEVKEAIPLKGKPVNAPMIGTFYRAPSPGAPPFVNVGDTVKEHSIIGIIEVMKVMSSIEAGTAGRISSILVENGQLVQYNQPLLLIESEEQSAEGGHE